MRRSCAMLTEGLRYQLNIETKPHICTVTEVLHSDQDFKTVCLQLCRTVEKTWQYSI